VTDELDSVVPVATVSPSAAAVVRLTTRPVVAVLASTGLAPGALVVSAARNGFVQAGGGAEAIPN
jgi:hypothetical protein